MVLLVFSIFKWYHGSGPTGVQLELKQDSGSIGLFGSTGGIQQSGSVRVHCRPGGGRSRHHCHGPVCRTDWDTTEGQCEGCNWLRAESMKRTRSNLGLDPIWRLTSWTSIFKWSNQSVRITQINVTWLMTGWTFKMKRECMLPIMSSVLKRQRLEVDVWTSRVLESLRRSLNVP